MSGQNAGGSTSGSSGANFGAGTSSISLPTVGGTPVTKTTSFASPSGGAASGRAIDVKPHTVTQSDVDALESEEIMSILNSLDADSVSKVSQAHQNLADTLTNNLTSIRSNATTLQGAWQGNAAQAAMNQFQDLHDQTAQLAAQAQQAANVYKWVAEEVIPQYKNLPSPHVESRTQADEQTGSSVGSKIAGKVGSWFGTGVGAAESAFGIGSGVTQAQANETARNYLKSLNNHLITANNSLPNPIGGGSAHIGGVPGSGGTGGGSTGSTPTSTASAPGAHAVAVTAGSGTAGSSSSVSHASASANALPQGKGNGGSGGTLAGASTTLPNTTTPPPVSTQTPPSPNSTGPSFLPTPISISKSGPGSDDPVLDETTGPNEKTLTDEDPLVDSKVGSADEAAEAEASEGAIGDEPAMGMGMGGAGSAAEDGLSASDSVTLRETNPDLAPDAVAGDAVIGDEAAADEAMTGADAEEGFFPMAGTGSGQRDDKERRRKAWLNEERDIWGAPSDSTPSVLDGGA